MKIQLKIICDCRESFTNNKNAYNDHFSKKSIEHIVDLINTLGYNCIHYGGINNLIQLYNSKQKLKDEYFLNFSDGLTQKNKRLQAPILLELLEVKYSGSEPFAIALANNKHVCKKMFKNNKYIHIPNDLLIFKNEINEINLSLLRFPVIIKPNDEGSSIGITKESLVTSKENILSYLKTYFKSFDSALIEEYIQGYEVTSLIIGNNSNQEQILPLLIECEGKAYFDKEIMDKEAKRMRKRTYVNPSNYLSQNCITELVEATKIIKETIGLKDIARVDFRVTTDEKIYFIEVNSNPVLSGSSELGAIEKIYNISEKLVIKNYIESFLNRVQS